MHRCHVLVRELGLVGRVTGRRLPLDHCAGSLSDLMEDWMKADSRAFRVWKWCKRFEWEILYCFARWFRWNVFAYVETGNPSTVAYRLVFPVERCTIMYPNDTQEVTKPHKNHCRNRVLLPQTLPSSIR